VVFSATASAASVIDLLLPVTTREAWDRARALACREGILAGPSSGATVAAAEHLLRTGRCRNPVAIVAGGMLEHLKFSENTAAG
jgi:cysteine synthase